MKLRPEVLLQARPDGGVDLYDPLLEQLFTVSAAEAASLTTLETCETLDDAALVVRLEDALLLEGPLAVELRRQVWASRVLPHLAAPAAGPVAFDPTLASALPELVAPPWRDPEAWRRLAEDRAAGRARLVLRGFLGVPERAALAAEVRALPFTRFETERIRAARAAPTSSPARSPALPAWHALLLAPTLRALVGGALGVDLPAHVVSNAWRMAPGDGMRAHPDGRRYTATWALGLNEGWTAADGGAITFGTPTPDGFVAEERWLPFAGDVCLFVPHARSWHVVEPPRRERLTLSGWWAPDPGGA